MLIINIFHLNITLSCSVFFYFALWWHWDVVINCKMRLINMLSRTPAPHSISAFFLRHNCQFFISIPNANWVWNFVWRILWGEYRHHSPFLCALIADGTCFSRFIYFFRPADLRSRIIRFFRICLMFSCEISKQ